MSLDGPVHEVAPTLLGAVLRAGDVAVRLTEVEGYAGESDPGSHAFRGRTPRTEVMFGPAGRAYVYFTYGMHWCLNVVTGPDGVDVAAARRPRSSVRDLARGPARLTKALGIDGSHGGVDLLDPGSPLTLTLGPAPDPAAVRTGPRVGVAGEGAVTEWRYWLDGEPTVSLYRPAVPRRRRVGA